MEDRFGRKVLKMKGQQMVQRQGVQVDLDKCEDVTCSAKDCGNVHFYTLIRMKKVSPLVSPTGQAMVIQVSELYCQKCHTKLEIDNTGEKRVKDGSEGQKESGQDQPGEFATTVPEVG